MIRFKKFNEHRIDESFKQAKAGSQEKIDEAKLEQLKTIKSIMNKNGANFWLDCGTMLGAVREKGFIKNDSDSDLGMRAKYISEDLINDFKKEFLATRIGGNKDDFMTLGLTAKNDKGKKLIIEGTEIFCDINVYYQIENRFCYSLRLEGKKGPYYYLSADVVNPGTKMIDLKGTKFPILKKTDEALEEMYGTGWKTPARAKSAYPNRCTTWVEKAKGLSYNRESDKMTCTWPGDFDWKNWEGK